MNTDFPAQETDDFFIWATNSKGTLWLNDGIIFILLTKWQALKAAESHDFIGVEALILTRLQDRLNCYSTIQQHVDCYMDKKKYAISEGYASFEYYFVGDFIICATIIMDVLVWYHRHETVH